MNGVKLAFWVTYFEKVTSDESGKANVKSKSALVDFGSNHSYFLIPVEQYTNQEIVLNSLKGTLEGKYCWISISYHNVSLFYVGINCHWLSKQIGNSLDLRNSIETVLHNWNETHSLFMSRYAAFYRDYQCVPHRELLMKSYFLQFLYLFVDAVLTEITKRNAQDFREIERQIIKELESKITSELHKSVPPIKEMAKMAGMSVSKFKILFYELYGTSPHQHILDKKMIYAQGLLQTGNYSLTQVAYKVGYHHPSGFIRIYRQKFNHSPTTTYFEKP